MEVFSKFFTIQILTHRNLEAFLKLEENTSNSKVSNNIHENIFFTEDNIRLNSRGLPLQNSQKQNYMEDLISSIKSQDIISFPFILIEFKDPRDVKILINIVLFSIGCNSKR